MLQKYRKEMILLIIFIAVFVFMSVFTDTFLTGANLQSMAFQLPEFGIMALAMMVVIVTGGINLSLTYSASLSGIAAALVMSSMYAGGEGMNEGTSVLVGLGVGLVVALMIGCFNGVIIAVLGVSPILVTLGTMILFKGIGQNLSKGRAVSGLPPALADLGTATVAGIPVLLLIFAAVALLTWLLLEKTPWGSSVYMVGSNITATNYSGINVKKVLFKVYVMSALLCYISSALMMSRYNSMKVDYGVSYLMQSVSAVVLGGTLITGGQGHVFGVVLASVLLQILTSGLSMLSLNRYFVDIIIGLILLLVLTINFIGEKIRLNRAEA